MKLTRAVITAAAPAQRTLPLQSIVDRDGVRKSVLSVLVAEAVGAGATDICVVVYPGDEAAYRDVVDAAYRSSVHFVAQHSPRG